MNICMLAYTFYEIDGRVVRYAETLAKRGDHVDVIALRHKGQLLHENIRGVNLFRIQERQLNEKGKLSYLLRLLKFFFKTTVFLSNMEDFLVMNAIYSDIFGDHKPARSTIEVARLPLDALIEVECIAVCSE